MAAMDLMAVEDLMEVESYHVFKRQQCMSFCVQQENNLVLVMFVFIGGGGHGGK